jgi:two-component system LytT family response regulator
LIEDRVIRALIVEDEPVAAAGLRAMLERSFGVEIAGDARDVSLAVAAIRDLRPDVVFLDIHMTGGGGFAVLRALQQDETPLVVFVTAYDEFAVRAFDVQAVDYVLKPVNERRLAQAVERIRVQLRSENASEIQRRLRTLIDDYAPDTLLQRAAGLARELTERPRYTSRLAVRIGKRSILIPAVEITWVAADGFCSVVHANGRSHVIRETLLSLSRRLDPEMFVRIHRSRLVNVTHVRQIQHGSWHSLAVLLSDGTPLEVSRRRRASVMRRLGPSR